MFLLFHYLSLFLLSLRSNIFRDGMNMNTFNQLYANDHHRPFEIQSNQLHSRKSISNKLPFMPSYRPLTSQSNITNMQMQMNMNMNMSNGNNHIYHTIQCRPDQNPPYWLNMAQKNCQQNSISNRFGGYLIKHNIFQIIKSTAFFLLGYIVFIYFVYVIYF